MGKWLTDPEQVWTDPDDQDTIREKRLVERAEAIIVNRFPKTERRIESGGLDVTVVAGVVEDMIGRYLGKQKRGGLDKLAYPEVSMEWTDGGAGTGSLLYLTIDDLHLLTPPPQAAFSIYKRPRPRW